MTTVTVYRIEHPDSEKGFLRHLITSSKRTDRLKQIRYNHGSFPTPETENLHIMEGLHKCAFISLTEMLESVGVKDIKYLVRKYGFKVYELVVKSDQIGDRQVLFTNHNTITKKSITNQFR